MHHLGPSHPLLVSVQVVDVEVLQVVPLVHLLALVHELPVICILLQFLGGGGTLVLSH